MTSEREKRGASLIKIFREHDVKTLIGFIFASVFSMDVSPFLIFNPLETG